MNIRNRFAQVMMHVQNPAGSKPLFRFGTAILALVMVLAGQLVSYVFAQENLSPDDGVFTQRVSGVGRLDDFGSYLRLQHYAGDGVGYTDSYTSLGLMQPLYQDGSLWFANTEFLLANDANVGANLGLGYRFYSPTWDRIFGASLWYDFDGRHVKGFQQMGVSLETLGELWDFRTNVYIPTGRTVQWLGGADAITWMSRFEQNHLILLGSRPAEVGMTGLDMELGTPLPGWLGQHGVRGYGGWYHFQAEDIPQAWGAMGRLEGQLTQNTSVQLTLTNDRVFDTNLVFGISWVFPGGSGRRGGKPANTYDRLLQPVQRRANVVVATDEDRDAGTVVAQDATSGHPIEVQHIDDTASAGGSGTFESPFRTLAEVQAGSDPGQVLYVHSGTYAGGITLQSGQRLLGDGMVHSLVTRQGIIDLPVLHPGELPLLVDGLQPVDYVPGHYAVVVAAANTEVSGFEIRPVDFLPAGNRDLLGVPPTGLAVMSDGYPAVFYPAASVGGTATGPVVGILAQGFTGDVNINGNTTQNGNDSGILVSDVTGDINIRGNTVSNISAHHGVHVEKITGDVAVIGNTVENITGNENDGILIGQRSLHPDGSARIIGNVTANENIIRNIDGRGLNCTDVSGSVEASRNTISSMPEMGGSGLYVSWIGNGDPHSTAVVENNTITDCALDGIIVDEVFTAVVRNNFVSNNVHAGICVEDARQVHILGNELHEGGFFGIIAYNTHHTAIEDNQIIDSEDGIYVFRQLFITPHYTGGTLAIRHNQIEGSTYGGMILSSVDALTTVEDNTITTVGPIASGVYCDNQTRDLTFTNNYISCPNAQAVTMIRESGDEDLIFTIQGNSVAGGGVFAIRSNSLDNGWTGVNLVDNTTDGVYQFVREGTGSQGAALKYYLQGNTGTVENVGGRATQVFSPITH